MKGENSMKNKLKKVIITTGTLLCLTMTPIAQNNPLGQYLNEMTTITAQAATYSDNWKMDGAGVWWYYLNDGSVAKDAWVKDYGEWYLLGSDGAMRTGVFQSNEGKYYLLDTVRNTGTYGKLLKNGAVYQGTTLKCDTSEAYEGALSDESISALKSAGVSFENVPNVENTKHVENGVITSIPSDSQQTINTAPSNNQTGNNGGLTADEKEFDFDGDGVLNQYEKESYGAMKNFDWDKWLEENPSTGGKLDWNI